MKTWSEVHPYRAGIYTVLGVVMLGLVFGVFLGGFYATALDIFNGWWEMLKS